jgi:gas vesicle protein
MPKHLSLSLFAAAAALLLAGAPALAKLDRDIVKSEKQACRQAAEGKVDKAKRVCDCMADGLSDGLDDDAYAALSRLVNQGEETEAGLAARETARAVVAQCLAG